MDKSEMPKTIFFWTLVVLFWLTSATIIGYAFGYRFSFSRGIFIYGGSITLKTTPQDADVYINNVLYSSKNLNRLNNSYHITGIPAGEYMLQVKAPGYGDWSKKITVHSGISTEFWNIILPSQDYPKTPYATSGVDRFFISPRKNLTAVAEKNGDIFSVNIIDASIESVNEVFSSNEFSFTNNEKENIEWSPQAHRIIIPSIKNDSGEKNYLITDIETKETLNLRDIVKKEDISHVRWDPKTKNALFFMSEGNLFRIDLDSPTEIKQIASNIASYELASSGLYYFQLPEGIVYQKNFDGTNDPVQITRKAPADMSDNSYQIIVYDEKRIVFLNNSHDLYVYNEGEKDTYFEELSKDALGSQFSDDGKKLLFWTNNEISTYFVRDWEVQPTRAENEIIPITRYAEQISNVQWSRDYEHVLFTIGKKLKLIELDQRDHRNLMDMITLNSDNSHVINNNGDSLIYYTDIDNQGVTKLYSIEFSTAPGLFEGLFPTTTTTTTTPAQ
jgi:hypothetical protein